jgi:hypothetical protein
MFSLKAKYMFGGTSFRMNSSIPDLQTIRYIDMHAIWQVAQTMPTKRDQGVVFSGSTS